MRFSAIGVVSLLLVTGCEIAPTNPYDPQTTPQDQAKATLRGTIVLDDASAGIDDTTLAAELASVVVFILDADGAPRTGADGAPLQPALVVDGRRASFAIELVPGGVRLDVKNVGSRFTPPTLAPLTLLPGTTVDLGELPFTYRPADGDTGPGSITGTVRLDGANGGERVVGVFRKVGDTQQRLTSLTTDAAGNFSVRGLAIGTYAIAATLDGFTPDYRLDVEIGEGGTAVLAQTFSGSNALTLQPITAVVLPLLDRVDGNFYTHQNDVDLAVLAFGGVSQMRLQTAACTAAAPACADVVFGDDTAFVDYAAAATVALPGVEGRVGVFAQFQARSANFVFASPVFFTTVIRDITPPAIRSVAVLGGAAADSIVATDDDVSFVVTVDDTGGVAGIGHLLADAVPAADVIVFSDITTVPGTTSLERQVGLPVDDGASSAWFFVRDRAGNVSTPASVTIVKDTAPASALPIVVEAVTPREGRAVDVVVSFDASTAVELPVELQLSVGSLPADLVTSRVAFVDGDSYVVSANAVDGETLVVRARLFDTVGNVTEVFGTTVVALRGSVAGTIDLERLGTTALLAGTVVTATGSDGRVLATTTTDATGRYVLASVVEGRAALTASANGYRGLTQDLGFVEASTDAVLDGFLSLQRGSLVGAVRRADLEQFEDRHGNTTVEVRLVSQTRVAAPRPALTAANGDWALDLVPATILGEHYQITATAEGYASVSATDIVVADNAVTVVNPDAVDPGTPAALLLQPQSGDFDLCAVSQVGGCTPLSFSNQNSVRVHLRDATGVTRVRAAATALPSEATLPLSAYDDDVGVVVSLPSSQGSIAIFADVERDGSRTTLGPVFVFRDTVAPQAPVVVIARGTTARRDGFTNQGFVKATITVSAADDDDRSVEAPLVNTPTFFAATVPTEPRSAGIALCTTGIACTVLLPSLAGVIVEQRHNLFAFACDAAGNCSSAPGTSAVVFDTTPPSALNGVGFAPTGSALVGSGSRFRTRSGAYAVAINVGTAKTAGGAAVVDVNGSGVRDVDAVALSFVAAIDAAATVTIVGADVAGATAVVAGLPLLGGQGDYDVFARFIDAAGNATLVEPNPFGFTLTLDETAPTGRLDLAGGASLTNSRTVAVAVSSLSETGTQAKLVVDAASCQSSAGYALTTALAATTTLNDLDGAQTLILCLRDDVGNIGFASDSIVLDRVAPTGSVVLDGGAAFSAARNFVASFQNVSSDVARVKAALRKTTSASLSCAVSTGYVAFASSVAVSVALVDPSGTYVVDACFEDAAGNRTALPASDSILFDTTPPTVTLVLNDDDAFTTSSEVRGTITAFDDIATAFVGMRFSSSSTFSGNSEGFATARAGLVLSAPTVEGSKTLCVEVQDELGRFAVDCDDIVLDLQAPVGTLTAPAFATSSPLTVSVRSNDLNIASVAVGEAIDCNTATFSALASASTVTRTVALADVVTSGARSVVACFKDAAGLVSRVERTTVFDFTDPPLATSLAPNDGAVVKTRRPQFSWSAVEGAATYTLIVRRVVGGAVELTRTGLTGLQHTPTVDLPELALEWIVVVIKASGRSSVQSFTAASRVTPDVTAPLAASAITIAVDANRSLINTPAPCTATTPCLNDTTPRLSFTSGSDLIDTSLEHALQIANAGDIAFAAPVFSIQRSDGSAFDVGFPLDDGAYKIRVRSIDDAGNVATSAIKDMIIDRTAPDAPSILPLQSPVSSVLAGTIRAGWTPEGPTGAVAYRFQLTTETRTFQNPLVDEVLAGVLNTTRDVTALLVAGAHVVHQVRVASIDALGNQSSFAVAGFVNDTTAPCGSGRTLTILGTDAANGFTDSAAVVVQIDCLSDPTDLFDGPVKMQLGCDGSAAGKPRTAFNGVASCVLPGVDGTKSAQAVVVDEAGNATAAFTDTIVLDRRTPTTPVLSIDSVVTNNPLFSFSIIEPSSDANFLRHEFMDGVEITSFDDARAIVLGNTVSLALIDERSYNVRVRGVDRAGNTSPEALANVTLDVTPPTKPIIADNAVPVVVNANAYTIFLATGASDRHFDHYELQRGAGAFVEVAGDGVFTVALTADTTTVFRIRGVDTAGNVGLADAITVVEDSRKPKALALSPLPAFINGGAPRAITSSTFTTRGAYVDVHFARSEIDVRPSAIDANFDHFEVKATHPTFSDFVPLCAVSTSLCTTTVLTDSGVSVVGADHLVFVDTTIAGFRMPVVRGANNDVTVRSVDKAGNISTETTVSTKEISVVTVTNDAAFEIEPSLFGDRLVYLDSSAVPPMVRLRLPGADALLGTADDTVTDLRQPSFFEPTAASAQAIAQGPDLVVQTATVTGVTQLFGFNGGGDRDLSTSPVQVGPLNQQATLSADQPSVWGTRLAFRQFEGGADTDIYVRDGGADGQIGTGDDVVSKVADDAVFQFMPQLSGLQLAFFQCATSACNLANEPRLVVVHAGVDRRFGTGDDVTRTLTQAINIDVAMRPQLYTPGTAGRAACRNVVAYAGKAGNKGVHVITTGPDGFFDVDDTPVQVMVSEALGSGSLRSFSMSDGVVVASDGFAPPRLEVVTAGPDGCLTRVADNIAFDSEIEAATNINTVHDGRVVSSRVAPTTDLVILELGAERPLWPRNELVQSPNAEADLDGVVFAGGGFFDLVSQKLRTAFAITFNEEADSSSGNIVHGIASGATGSAPTFTTLTVNQRGVDDIWGSADDAAPVILSAQRPLLLDSNSTRAFQSTMAVDGDTVVWAGRKLGASLVVPVLRNAGVDRRFGTADDCEVELSSVADNGYKSLRSSLKRQVFQRCTDLGCGNIVGEISVREVTGNVCSGTATVTPLVAFGNAPDIDGPRMVFINASGTGAVRVIDGGLDGKLTTVADNVDTRLSQFAIDIVQAPRVSGDRVVWIDSRYQTPRTMLGDIADGSERVVSRSTNAATSPSIAGDLIVWGNAVATFSTDVVTGYIGLQPDLPHDQRALGPTVLRCPDDDRYEENDSSLTATPMNGGAALNGIICAADEDRFKIAVPAVGCVVRAKSHFVHADGNLELSLLNPSGAVVVSSTGVTNDESVTFTAAAVGDHVVRVFGAGAAEGAYDVGVTVSCP